PPLVRDLVWRNHLPVATGIVKPELMLHGAVIERADWQINQRWPRLPKAAGRLLRHRKVLIGQRTKIIRVDADRELRFSQGLVHQRSGSHAAQSHAGNVRALPAWQTSLRFVLESVNKAGRVLIGK